MKSIKLFFCAAFISIFLMSCSDNQEEIKTIRKNVMDIHDEEMAKMDQVMKLKKSLQILVEDSAINDSEKTTINTNIEKLKIADKAMMDWMHDYDEPEETLSNEEKKKYFETEFVKIKDVRTKMDESIHDAETTLKNYENK